MNKTIARILKAHSHSMSGGSIFIGIVLIIVKIYQTSIVITLSKIMNFTAIIHVIPPSYMFGYKRTNYRKYTVFNKGVSLWNSINEDIKNTISYLSFKKKAKLYYLVSD